MAQIYVHTRTRAQWIIRRFWSWNDIAWFGNKETEEERRKTACTRVFSEETAARRVQRETRKGREIEFAAGTSSSLYTRRILSCVHFSSSRAAVAGCALKNARRTDRCINKKIARRILSTFLPPSNSSDVDYFSRRISSSDSFVRIIRLNGSPRFHYYSWFFGGEIVSPEIFVIFNGRRTVVEFKKKAKDEWFDGRLMIKLLIQLEEYKGNNLPVNCITVLQYSDEGQVIYELEICFCIRDIQDFRILASRFSIE